MNYQLIDTHAHLYYEEFNPDFDQVIERAQACRVSHIINIGADLEGSQKAVSLENDQIKMLASIGLHPHEIQKLINLEKNNSLSFESIHPNIINMVGELERMHQNNSKKIVAVGECGLDYYVPSNIPPLPLPESQQKKFQKELFGLQITLAKKLNLPLIIHCRPSTSSGLKDAWEDIFLSELSGMSGVFHSFTGNYKAAQKALDLGFYLGFSCIITYPKNEHLRQIIKNTPLDKILTETDCPYLPPQTMRGQRNEPANIAEVVNTIAAVKGLSFKEASQTTLQNAQKLFRLTEKFAFAV